MDIFATSDRLRLIGVLAVAVGLAWALQVLGSGGVGLAGSIWILGAGVLAGGGTGLVCVSETAVNARASARIEDRS